MTQTQTQHLSVKQQGYSYFPCPHAANVSRTHTEMCESYSYHSFLLALELVKTRGRIDEALLLRCPN